MVSNVDDFNLHDGDVLTEEDFIGEPGQDTPAIDLGEELGDFLGEASGAEDWTTGNDERQTGKQEVFGAVKKVVPLLLVALLAVCLAIGYLSGSGKDNESKTTNKPTESVQATYTTPPAVQNQSSSTPSISDSWVWVSADSELTFSEPISSVFTVTDVKLVSLVIEGKDMVELDSIVKGSIDGLRGTYEVRIPYNLAVLLSVGTELNCEYRVGEKGSVKFITGIKF